MVRVFFLELHGSLCEHSHFLLACKIHKLQQVMNLFVSAYHGLFGPLS
jgi:hypothetical protein